MRAGFYVVALAIFVVLALRLAISPVTWPFALGWFATIVALFMILRPRP